MDKKQGFSLIEILAAIAILALFFLVIFGVVMNGQKGQETNSNMVNETSIMSGVASTLFTEKSSYYRENLGATISNVGNGEKFVIEASNLTEVVNILQNKINSNQSLYPYNGVANYVVVLKPGMLDTNIWGCKITVYTLKTPKNLSEDSLEEVINYGESNGRIDTKNIIKYFNEKPKGNNVDEISKNTSDSLTPNLPNFPNWTWKSNKNIWKENGYWFCNYKNQKWILYNGSWRKVQIGILYYDICIDGTWYEVWK